MGKTYTTAQKFFRAISDHMITVTNVQRDYSESGLLTENIEPDKFVADLANYSKSGMFSNMIEFEYTVTGEKFLLINVIDMNEICICKVSINARVNDDASMDSVTKLLSGTIFDTLENKTENDTVYTTVSSN